LGGKKAVGTRARGTVWRAFLGPKMYSGPCARPRRPREQAQTARRPQSVGAASRGGVGCGESGARALSRARGAAPAAGAGLGRRGGRAARATSAGSDSLRRLRLVARSWRCRAFWSISACARGSAGRGRLAWRRGARGAGPDGLFAARGIGADPPLSGEWARPGPASGPPLRRRGGGGRGQSLRGL